MQDDIGFGMVIFDDPTQHQSGWACRWAQDATGVVRISDTGELTSDTVWLTSLGYEVARAAGIEGSRFRRADFLGQPIERLWYELGLAPDQMRVSPGHVWSGRFSQPTMLRAALSAWAFRQVALGASAIVPMAAPPLFDLARGFHERLIPGPRSYYTRGRLPPEPVLDALIQADQTWQPASRVGEWLGDRVSIRLFPERVFHSVQMLGSHWPVGRWKDTGDLKILSNQSEDVIAEWLEENPTALLRVTVQRTDRDMESLINYGANISRNARQGRWLVAADVLRILPWCQLRLHRGYVAEDTVCGLDWLARAGIELEADDIEFRSGAWSFGVVMNALWRGMIRPPQEEKVGPSAAYLRAFDRAYLFPSVQELAMQGYSVTGYGSGGITISVEDDTDIQQLVSDAMRLGLSPLVCMPGTFTVDQAVEMVNRHDHRPEAMRRMHTAMLLGDLDTVIQMDEALALWTTRARPIEEKEA